MVCVTITSRHFGTRGSPDADDELEKIRDGLHDAIVKVISVMSEDVELRVRGPGRLDRNTPPLAIDIEMGPGKDNWRVDEVREIALKLNAELVKNDVVPKRYRHKGSSNMWVKVLLKGASLPIGHPELIH